jgi:hypothetical protein
MFVYTQAAEFFPMPHTRVSSLYRFSPPFAACSCFDGILTDISHSIRCHCLIFDIIFAKIYAYAIDVYFDDAITIAVFLLFFLPSDDAASFATRYTYMLRF